MKKFLSLLLASAMVLSLVACSSGQTNESAAPGESGAVTESGAPAGPSSIAVCIASEPDTIDPALNSAVDGATLTSHLFSGLAKWAQDDSGKLVIVPDAATELPEGVVNADGTVTYTYTLKDKVTWSDGKPVTAGDFVFAWNRAAGTELAADYGYMFEVVDGYADIWEVDDAGNYVNPDATLNVKAVDDKTLEVTLANAVAYWNELLAFPTYFPVREDVVSNEAWATDPSTYVSNGAYKMTGWDHNSVITLEKNEHFHDADEILMDKIEFYLSDDENNMLTNFQNGDWLLIDDVPTNEIANLKATDDQFKIGSQLGTYYACWNINEEILPASSTLTGVEAEKARQEIRKAVALLLDRNYLVESVTQAGQLPASSFVAMGMTEPDGTEFYQNTGVSSDFDGYYDVSKDALESNFASAVETLKKYYTYDEASGKFTDFPSITYLYNTNDAHKAIGEYLQAAVSAVGINMNLENQEWNTFLNTRKNGDYAMARNGWLADYNDPICFLDMWTSGSGNNDIQYGKGAHKDLAMYNLDLTGLGYDDIKVENGTWAQTYDVLISTIKSCTDNEKRYEMMHMAEDMLMDTGCIVPLYFYTDPYMLSNKVDGFFANPLGYKYFMYCTVNG